MKRFCIILPSIFFLSCNSNSEKRKTARLEYWLLTHKIQLEKDIDTIIKEDSTESRYPNWVSQSILSTMYAPNSLGTFAKIAGDSTECITVVLTFYKDKTRKREIIVAAQDSSCLDKLHSIQLKTDSIDNFIFGKKIQPLYTKQGDPL